MLYLLDLFDTYFGARLIIGVSSGVQADNLDIGMVTHRYLPAGVTLTTGRLITLAVYRPGQIQRQGHLANVSEANQEISMSYGSLLQTALE